jgi:hypothetical protein
MKENKVQCEISSDTKFISREGRIYKVVTTTTLVGTGEILDGQNDPSLAEFQQTTGLGKKDDKQPSGMV